MNEARARVIDSLACFYGASTLLSIRRLNHAFSDATSGPCSRWGTSSSVSPERSVLVNGAGVRALDYNDTYLSKEPCHPSDTLAALWAAAEISGGPRQGRRVLTGLVQSYEVMVRLCDAASLRSRGWDHVTYLPIASAVGCASIFNLSVEKTMHAVALAVCGSTALRQTRVGTISDWKAACAANAARAGLVGTLLARSGFTGPSNIFSGRMGFERQVSGPLLFKSGGIGKPWGILRTHVKYFPAEHHAQSAIECALALRHQILFPAPQGEGVGVGSSTALFQLFKDAGSFGDSAPLLTSPLTGRGKYKGGEKIRVRDIRSITVGAFEAAVSIIGSEKEKWKPTTRETADHSLPYLVAVALLDGDVTLGQYERRRYLNSNVKALMKKIKIRAIPSYDRLYPRTMPTRLTITFKGGKKISKEVKLPKGYAGRPFEPMDLKAKFDRLTGPVLPASRRVKLWKSLSRFDRLNKLSTLKSLMRIA